MLSSDDDVSATDKSAAVSGTDSITGVGHAVAVGNWAALFKAVNISTLKCLSTQLMMTLDNQEAEFFSGQEISIATGIQRR